MKSNSEKEGLFSFYLNGSEFPGRYVFMRRLLCDFYRNAAKAAEYAGFSTKFTETHTAKILSAIIAQEYNLGGGRVYGKR